MKNRLLLAAAASGLALAAVVGVASTHRPQEHLAVVAGSVSDPAPLPADTPTTTAPLADETTTTTTAPAAPAVSTPTTSATSAPAMATTSTTAPEAPATTSTTSTTVTTVPTPTTETTTPPGPQTVELAHVDKANPVSVPFTTQTTAQQLTWSFSSTEMNELFVCINTTTEYCNGIHVPGPSGTLTIERDPGAQWTIFIPEASQPQYGSFSVTLSEVRPAS